MNQQPRSWLRETAWLADNLGRSDLAILDGSWHLPNENRNAAEEFLQAHIPGALFFDIDEVADQDTDLPHMLPPPGQFSAHVRRLGIGNNTQVVVYDSRGLFSAARVWWMFRAMGHDDIYVLNGGLPKWRGEGRPVERGRPDRRRASHFTAALRPERVKSWEEVLVCLVAPLPQLVDARDPVRFRGEGQEPRAGMRAGHIPSALNVHYQTLLNADGTVKPPSEIEALFAAAGVHLDQPIITSCGSGVTGALLAFAIALTGRDHAAVYDGSWVEWGGRTDTPVETGPARSCAGEM